MEREIGGKRKKERGVKENRKTKNCEQMQKRKKRHKNNSTFKQVRRNVEKWESERTEEHSVSLW